VIGNKREQALPLMNYLAARGWVCVAANYRLSPRATFPDHLIDLKCALRWIREHIDEFGGDPRFVAVSGGSAGGHLSSLLALTAGDPEYQPGFEELDTSVRACVPFYGVYDPAGLYGLHAQHGIESFFERVVMKKSLAEEPEAFRKASPMHRIHAEAPPFFVIHGSHDSLAPVEEARHFAKLLRETSKAPVAYAEIPGAQHAFEVFHSKRTTHVTHAVGRFLSYLHSQYLRERGAA
jgi:acetyl esterase/lipase